MNAFKDFKPVVVSILVAAIILTLIASFGVFYSGYWVKTGKTCDNNLYTDYQGGALGPKYILLNGSDKVLQQFDLPTEDLTYQFCFTANSTHDQEVRLVSDNLTIKGRGYFIYGEHKLCFPVDLESGTQYLGINCPGCTQAKNMTLYEELSGKNVIQLLTTSGDFSIQYLNTLDYQVKARESCKFWITRWLWLYAFAMFLLAIIVLVIVGYNKLKEILIDDMGKLTR